MERMGGHKTGHGDKGSQPIWEARRAANRLKGLDRNGAPGEIRTPDPLVRSQTKGATRGIAGSGSATKHGQVTATHCLTLPAFACGAGTMSGTIPPRQGRPRYVRFRFAVAS
jgi:hypothetical protein